MRVSTRFPAIMPRVGLTCAAALLAGGCFGTPPLPVAPNFPDSSTSGTPAAGSRGKHGGLLTPAGSGRVEVVALGDYTRNVLKVWLIPYDAGSSPLPAGTALSGVVQLPGATGGLQPLVPFLAGGNTPALYGAVPVDPTGTWTLPATASIAGTEYPLVVTYP